MELNNKIWTQFSYCEKNSVKRARYNIKDIAYLSNFNNVKTTELMTQKENEMRLMVPGHLLAIHNVQLFVLN